MNRNREQLIQALTSNLQPVRPGNVLLYALLWLVAAFTLTALLTYLAGPYRPGAAGELFSSMQFLLETIAGIFAAGLLVYSACRLAVPAPGSLTGRLLLPLGALFLWTGFYLYGLVQPSPEPSMAGKREYCYAETFLYALTVMAVALVHARRQWPLHPVTTGFLAGLAAGVVPALIMQFACMYDPHHSLTHHIFPGLMAGAAGAVLGKIMLRTR